MPRNSRRGNPSSISTSTTTSGTRISATGIPAPGVPASGCGPSTRKTPAEAVMATPALEARNPLLAVAATGTGDKLPAEQAGLTVSRKGVTVTAFGQNPDGTGTLLRVWEKAGVSGELSVKLPAGAKFKTAQPVNLRGEKAGGPSSNSQPRIHVQPRRLCAGQFRSGVISVNHTVAIIIVTVSLSSPAFAKVTVKTEQLNPADPGVEFQDASRARRVRTSRAIQASPSSATGRRKLACRRTGCTTACCPGRASKRATSSRSPISTPTAVASSWTWARFSRLPPWPRIRWQGRYGPGFIKGQRAPQVYALYGSAAANPDAAISTAAIGSRSPKWTPGPT